MDPSTLLGSSTELLKDVGISIVLAKIYRHGRFCLELHIETNSEPGEKPSPSFA